MRCVPTQKNTRIRAVIAALIVFGAASYAVPIICTARGIVISGAIFQLATVIAVVAAVFVMVRYQMTGFVYIIRPRSSIAENGMETAYAGGASLDISRLPPDMLDFVVTKSQGSRAGITECVLPLSDLVAAIPQSGSSAQMKKQLREKYQSEGCACYDYTITLGITDALVLVFVDGSRYAVLFIEPDSAMRAYLTNL